MSALEPALRSLTDALLDAVGRRDWAVADAELETLAQEAVAAMVANRTEDLATLARLVARCHTALSLADGLDGEAMHRLGQLRALALTVAAARGTPPRPARPVRSALPARRPLRSCRRWAPVRGPALPWSRPPACRRRRWAAPPAGAARRRPRPLLAGRAADRQRTGGWGGAPNRFPVGMVLNR